MTSTTLLTVGSLLIGLGLLAFGATYSLLVKKPEFLLGSLTMLWFRCLTWIVITGLSLLGLEALHQVIFTVLFWRR
jgi:hypothetical protein